MPKPDWCIDSIGESMAEAGIKVNTTTKPAFFGRTEYSPAAQKPPVRVPLAGKRQTGRPQWIIRSRKSGPDRCRRPIFTLRDGMRRGVFSEKALLKIIF
jgi:hypothetical protein